MSRFAQLGMVRDFLALSGGEVLSRIAGFAAFAYLARVLAPEAYGAVELAVSLSLLFGFVVDFGIGAIGTREIARDPARATALAAEIPAARLLVSAFAIPAMGLTAIALGQPADTVALVWLFAVGLLAAPWRQQWLLQGLEMMTWVSAANAVRMFVFAGGVVLWVRAPHDLAAVGHVEIASAAVLAGYFIWVQGRKITRVRLSFSPAALKALMGEGMPLGLTQLVWSATQYLPTMLVAAYLGGAVLAWFGAAHRIVMSLWAFSWLYHFNLFPSLARGLGESRAAFQALVRPSLNVTAWAGVGVALVVTLLAEPLCRLAFGEKFSVAGPALAIAVWVVPATLLSGHARSALVAHGLQRFVLYAQLVGAVVMLAIGVWLVPAMGAAGGAVAMTVSSVAVCFVSQAFATRWVAPMPLLSELARPGAAALLAAVAVRAIGMGTWWDGAAAGMLFGLGALAVDRRLVADVRTLATARGPAREAGGTGRLTDVEP